MTKIAIIDDNDTLRRMLSELIDSEPGLRCVCTCTTCKEAMIQVPKSQPDIALIDIHLPDDSGINCTAKLTELMPQLQVIIVTIYKDIELIFQALEAGACGYILKRSRPEEIIQAIAEVRAGGAPMTGEIARLLVESFRAPSVAPDTRLSARESEILDLVVKGFSNKEIAQKTSIASGTVRNHLARIFKKLHVRNRTEAATKFTRKRK